VDQDEFKKMFEELNRRRIAFLKGKKQDEDFTRADVAKVFIVDFRLLESTIPGVNGEEFAYNLLCFSDCEYIMGLNRYYIERTFDLTLSGHLDSRADLNIGSQDLDNQGLWTGESTGYRPWYWPAVLNYLKNREKQISDVENNFESSISETLKIPEHIMRSIPISASNYLGISGKDITRTTFKDFFLKSSFLTPKERKIELKRKAKIVASRLSKWFERAILPGQHILVDAPHLVLRLPSLLEGNKENINTWNKTVKFVSAKELGFHHHKIEKSLFNQHWLSRPAWFWPEVSEMAEIEEVKEPWKRKDFGFVFAEDASSFYKKKECRDFLSNVDSPFRLRNIRYFRKDGSVDYRPAHLLFKR
jgi:hypothetical protein